MFVRRHSGRAIGIVARDLYPFGDRAAYVGFEPADCAGAEGYQSWKCAGLDVEINRAAGKPCAGFDLLPPKNRWLSMD